MLIGPAIAGAVMALGVLIGLSAFGRINGSTMIIAAEELIIRGWSPLLWLAGAIGYGSVLQRWLVPATKHIWTVRCGLGVAALLALDALLGRLGLLTFAGGAVAWGILVIGLSLLIRLRPRDWKPEISPGLSRWVVALAAVGPLVVLVLAALSAPGWLWASEFGGYDVLSYHLQLPKEWLADGRIKGLEHNVYSFLPSYMEGAFLHLACLHRGVLPAAIGCQLLHALITLMTAGATGQALIAGIGRRKGAVQPGDAKVSGGIAMAVVLVTPWTIVVGSLAYSEMATALMLAVGLLLLLEPASRAHGLKLAVALGILLGAAAGAKLTALGMVAGPLLVVMFVQNLMCARRVGAFGRAVLEPIIAGSVMLAVLSPALVSNTIQTGNPVFPMASGMFGTGHWTESQVDQFERVHQPEMTLEDRFAESARQSMFHVEHMPGDAKSPWRWHFGFTPMLAVFGAIVALGGSRTWRCMLMVGVVLALQYVFWVEMTHIKARFMVPAIIPMAMLFALGLQAFADECRGRWIHRLETIGTSIGVIVISILPVWIYSAQHDGQPALGIGAVDAMSGALHAELAAQGELGEADLRSAPPGFWINHVLGDEARVLLIGESTPLYLNLDRITYTTVWDMGVMNDLVRTTPDDPDGWRAALRAQGYTHVLINRTMLKVWLWSRYNDRVLTTQAMKPMILENRQIADMPGDIRLVELVGE